MESLDQRNTPKTHVRCVILVSNHGEIIGGGEVSLLTLLKGLDRANWAPILVVPSEGQVAAGSRALGIPAYVIPLPGLRRPRPALFQSLWRLTGLVRKTAAVLLHANGSRAMFYAGVAGLLTGRPVVWHLRVLDHDPTLDWLLARLATRTITNSKAVRGRLRRWPRAHDRSVVVPNGIDLDTFVPLKKLDTVRNELGLHPGKRVIGTVGRLVPFKGHRYLLDAFVLILQNNTGIRLLIVGDGPEREALERRAQALGIASAVTFLGHREDVADLLSVMDIFVLPSVEEGFGRVVLEAMALKLPVVATAAGGVVEVVEDKVTGLLVRSEDPRALASAIETFLEDPACARAMGFAGRRRVEQYYTLRRHAQLVEAVYDEVARACQGVIPRGET